MAETNLKTIPQLAREWGITVRRVEWARDAYDVQPTEYIGAGKVRVFDPTAAALLKSAILRVASNRTEVAHA